MNTKLYCLILSLFILSNKMEAQNDTLLPLHLGEALTLDFPTAHSDNKGVDKEVMEGRNNGIIYTLFISDEYKYRPIQNGLQLDSLYDLITFNTLQIYATSNVESDSYSLKFGELRGKYLQVKNNSSTNPYIAEYYMVCVSGRIFLMSTTYLSTYAEAQIKQAKDFVNHIHFNEKLGYNDQMNRY